MMKKEIELILLGCIAKRNEKEEERFSNLLECSEDWAFITGELIRHRLNGIFYDTGVGVFLWRFSKKKKCS